MFALRRNVERLRIGDGLALCVNVFGWALKVVIFLVQLIFSIPTAFRKTHVFVNKRRSDIEYIELVWIFAIAASFMLTMAPFLFVLDYPSAPLSAHWPDLLIAIIVCNLLSLFYEGMRRRRTEEEIKFAKNQAIQQKTTP